MSNQQCPFCPQWWGIPQETWSTVTQASVQGVPSCDACAKTLARLTPDEQAEYVEEAKRAQEVAR